jgi:hypothetical protein
MVTATWIGTATWADAVTAIAAAVGCFFTVIGGIFALLQWKKNCSLKKAEFVNNFIKNIRDDEDIIVTLKFLDESDSWYSIKFHDSDDENEQKFEQRMDKTLSYFSYICYLRKKKIIKDKEFNFFNWHLKLILMNPGIQDYFYHLYHYVTGKFRANFQYQCLLDYGIKAQIIDDDIYNPNAHLRNSKYTAPFDSWSAQ